MTQLYIHILEDIFSYLVKKPYVMLFTQFNSSFFQFAIFQATLNLNAINKFEGAAKPWRLTFCYGRALQGSALAAWNGNDANVKELHSAFAKMADNNSKASMGEF